MEFKGIHTALITPFDRNGELDQVGLKKLLQRQIDAEIDGVLVLGTTGETPTLSRTECDSVISIAVEFCSGKIPVMVGTGSNSTYHAVENTKRAEDLGAQSALVVSPYYNKPTQSGLIKHFEKIHAATNLPIVVYNIRGRTGVNIETSTMLRLTEFPRIVGVKEASGDLKQVADVIAEIQMRQTSFSVLSGDDEDTLAILALGGRGVVSVVSNLIPKELKLLVEAGMQGNFERAREIHFKYLPLFRAAFIETNPIPIKTALALAGLPAGGCRLPLCELQPASTKKLQDTLSGLKLLA